MMSAELQSPFHAGEIAMQTRAGVRERMQQVEHKLMRDFMPEQHRELFEKLPTLLVGSLDASRRPWASMLVGKPGFVRAPGERTLRIAASPRHGDPLAENLAVGAPLGLLGIEPQTRRRNRMNGTVMQADAAGFTVQVDQSFGNCPQYIQAREPRWAGEPQASDSPRQVVRESSLLTPAAQALVRRADTFFIASAAPQARGHAGAHGVDVSHRGGKPGFVLVAEQEGQTVLTAPDFRGNSFFNTLGNVAAHPHAGLLFVDYGSGDLLQLAVVAEVIWDGPEVEAFAGAQRLLRMRVEEGWWAPHALPLRWSDPQYAPQLEATTPEHLAVQL